jgi:hypothetical protein
MAEHEASRTLVKSTPELWAECSDAASLARHLGAFGEICITKLEPETAVAWEGEDVCGTVTLEPAGWGTRVTLTAVSESSGEDVTPGPESAAADPAATVAEPPEPPESSQPPEAPEPPPASVDGRAGLLRRLFGGRRRAQLSPVPRLPRAAAATGAAEAAGRWSLAPGKTEETTPEPTPEAGPLAAGSAALLGALDSLGTAHRRPFSHP